MREYRLRRSVAERNEQSGVAAALRGQDESEVLRVLLDSDGEAAVLLGNTEFLRTAIARILMRFVADAKASKRERLSSASMLVELLALDKGSKVAEVERQIREVMEKLKGEPNTVALETSLGSE
jgi:hypothetical protein